METMSHLLGQLVGKEVIVYDAQVIVRGTLHNAHELYSVREKLGRHTSQRVAFMPHQVSHSVQNRIYLDEDTD